MVVMTKIIRYTNSNAPPWRVIVATNNMAITISMYHEHKRP